MGVAPHVKFWILMILAAFLLVPLLQSSKDMDSFARQELEITNEVFGAKATTWLSNNAAVVFTLLPSESTGSVRITGAGMERTKRIVPGPGVAIAVAFNGYVDRLLKNAYVATLRLFIVAIWFCILAPVFIASVVDGFTQRAIKRIEFGAIRPAAFALASIVVVPLSMLPFIYLIIPITINPLVAPLWALVMAMPLAFMVANMQPIFGRN